MSKVNVVKLINLKDVEYIVDYLKKKSPIKIDFSTMRHSVKKEANNKAMSSFSSPTIDCRIQLFNSKTKANLFKPYDFNEEDFKTAKASQKLNIGFGRVEDNNQDIYEKMFKLSYTLAEAFDYYFISKITKIPIEESDTDVSFLNKVAKSINYNVEEDEFKEYIELITSTKVFKSIKDEFTNESENDIKYRIMNLFKTKLLVRMKETKFAIEDKVVAKIFSNAKAFIPSSFPFKFTNKTNSETNETFELFNGKFAFIFSTGKNDRFATKLIQNKMITPLTFRKYIEMAENKSRKDCNFVCDIIYNIKSFSDKVFKQVNFEIKQCLVDEASHDDTDPILFDLDEENEYNDEYEVEVEM